jgi:hypothetical protein
MMIIENKFNFGDIVYLKTDPDQRARIVTTFSVGVHSMLYELSCGTITSWHRDFEISTEKDVLITTTN